MRLTQDSLTIVKQNQLRAFCERGADILIRLYPDVIQWRDLSHQSLLNLITDTYIWTEEHARSSQLLAVRIACARLCLGSFFMQDPRYSDLQNIVKQQMSLYRLTDDDPINQYLITIKSDWSKDAFKEQLPQLSELSTSILTYLDYEDWMKRLLINDWRISKPKENQEQQALFQTLTLLARNELKSSDEFLTFLLTVAQYYDGINCFNDPLSIRWFEKIIHNAPTLTHNNIISAFKPSGGY